MIPRHWTDVSTPNVPYSTQAPLVERLLRHSGAKSGKWVLVVWLVCFGGSIGVIQILPSLPAFLMNGALVLAWVVTLVMILAAAFLGATISGEQVRGEAYQLLWLTALSNHALASSLLVGTLYRLRTGIAVMGGIVPIVLYGMVERGLWGVETSSCPTTWEMGWCREQYTVVESLPMSVILGLSLWLSLAALLPVGAMLGVWLGMRWRQASIAAVTAVGMMSAVVLLVGTLGVWAVEMIPPIREPTVWSAELGLFSGMMVVMLTAVVFWRDGLMEDEGIETLLYILGAIVILGCGLGFYVAHPMTRGLLVNVFGVLAIPYGLVGVGVNWFWRGARRQVDDWAG